MGRRRAAFALVLAVGVGATPALAEGFEAPAGAPALSEDLFNPYPYSLTVRGWVGYDSNVLLVPTTPPFFTGDTRASPAAGLSIDGSYRFPVNQMVTLGVALRADGVLYTAKQGAGIPATNDDPSEYSMLVLHPVAFAEIRFLHGGIPSKATFSYGFRRENGNGVHALGLNSHQLGARFDAAFNPDLNLFAAIDHTIDDFDVTSINRDGTNTTVSAGGRYYFNGHRQSIGFSLAYLNNAATGIDWDYTGWTVAGDIKSHLGGRLYGKLGFSYSDRAHAGGFIGLGGIPAPGRTSEKIATVTGSLMYIFDRKWTGDAYVTWETTTGNMSQFSGNRWTGGVGLTARLP